MSNSRRSSVKLVVLLLCAATILVLGIAQVSRRHQFVRVGYELSQATQQERAMREENDRLRLEISVLTNPARVQGIARSLGLTQPAPEQIRIVDAASAPAMTRAAP